MPTLPNNRDRADQLGGRGLKPAPGQVLGFGQDIVSAHALSGGDNDLDSHIASLTTSAATADSKAVSAQSAATAAQSAAIAAQTDATRALADAVTAQSTADAALPKSGGTMTGALTLSGAPTADRHAATKKYVDDNAGGGGGGTPNALGLPSWGDLSGTIAKGTVVSHNGRPFLAKQDHTKGGADGNGPDGDPTNWWALDNWVGEIHTAAYFAAGSEGYTGSGATLKIWRASAFVLSDDPLPTDTANTKWKQIWPAETPTSDAAIPALQAAVQDIIVGDVVDHNWQDVNSNGSEGGVGENHDTTNAAARAATYSSPSFSDGNTDNFILLRIPRGSDIRHYQVIISGVEGAIGANLLLALGHSADNSWSYYGYGYAEINAFAGSSHTVTLQISDRVLAHTTWDGQLGPAAIASLPATAPVVLHEDPLTGTRPTHALDSWRNVELSQAPVEASILSIEIFTSATGTIAQVEITGKEFLSLPVLTPTGSTDTIPSNERVYSMAFNMPGDTTVGGVGGGSVSIGRYADDEMGFLFASQASNPWLRITMYPTTGRGDPGPKGAKGDPGDSGGRLAFEQVAQDTDVDYVSGRFEPTSIAVPSEDGLYGIQFTENDHVHLFTRAALLSKASSAQVAPTAANALRFEGDTLNLGYNSTTQLLSVENGTGTANQTVTLYQVGAATGAGTQLVNHASLPDVSGHELRDLVIANDDWYELEDVAGTNTWQPADIQKLGLRRLRLSNNTGVNFEGVTFPYSGRLTHASARDLVYAELSDGTDTWVMKYKGVSSGGNIDFEDAGESGKEIHFQANNAGVRLFVQNDRDDTTLSALLVFADGLFATRLIPLSGQIDNHHLIWTDSATTATWNNPGRILTANAADAIYQGLLVAPYWKRLELEIEYSAGSPALYEHALATIATVRGGGGGKVNNPVRLHGIAFMGALLDIQINLVRGGQIRADNSHLKISGVSWASGTETFNVKLYGIR